MTLSRPLLGVLVAAMFMAAAGCTPLSVYVKTHSQGDLPPSDVALLKTAAGVYITHINGEPKLLAHDYVRSTEFEIEFLPGVHRLRVGYDNGSQHSMGTMTMEANFQPNRRYLLKANSTNRLFARNSWTPEIVDVTDKPQCWTFKVGVQGGVKGC